MPLLPFPVDIPLLYFVVKCCYLASATPGFHQLHWNQGTHLSGRNLRIIPDLKVHNLRCFRSCWLLVTARHSAVQELGQSSTSKPESKWSSSSVPLAPSADNLHSLGWQRRRNIYGVQILHHRKENLKLRGNTLITSIPSTVKV